MNIKTIKERARILFEDRWYNVLKYICMIALPACAALYGTLASIWHLPYATEIVATINAVAAFIGALLCISSARYWKHRRSVKKTLDKQNNV